MFTLLLSLWMLTKERSWVPASIILGGPGIPMVWIRAKLRSTSILSLLTRMAMPLLSVVVVHIFVIIQPVAMSVSVTSSPVLILLKKPWLFINSLLVPHRIIALPLHCPLLQLSLEQLPLVMSSPSRRWLWIPLRLHLWLPIRSPLNPRESLLSIIMVNWPSLVQAQLLWPLPSLMVMKRISQLLPAILLRLTPWLGTEKVRKILILLLRP